MRILWAGTCTGVIAAGLFGAAACSDTATSATATDAGTHTPQAVPEGGATNGTLAGVPNADTACVAQAAAGSIGAINVTSLDESVTVPMCIYKGAVLLIVNTASHCGYTPQYTPLEAIYKKYGAQNFYVLGFPSQSFNQEDADASTVSTFCTTTYGITFPMFKIANVNAPDEQPLYTWLKGHQDAGGGDIEWNFAKFIIAKDGTLVQRFAHTITPDDPMVTSVIEAELAK
jgi:glutathione peroxidase